MEVVVLGLIVVLMGLVTSLDMKIRKLQRTLEEVKSQTSKANELGSS